MRLCFLTALVLGGHAVVGWSAGVDLPPFDPAQPAAQMKPIERVVTLPPAPQFHVRAYGATGDGKTDETAAIQKAIDACAGSGGSVVLDAGNYVSGPLELKARMTFYLDKGATLLGSLKPEDYPEKFPAKTSSTANKRSLIYAFQADDLVIDGPGEINGRGRELAMNGLEPFRPSLMRIFNSRHVAVRSVTFRNPRMWTCVYVECTDLTIENTTTDSPPYCPNLDGMDICDCQDVVIRNNIVYSEDDSICLKSSSLRGMKNILIENNRIVSYHANAIKLGTATRGPVEDLRIFNNTVYGARYGGLCLESVDGSQVKNVRVRGLDLYRVGQPIYLRLDHRQTGPPEAPPGSAPKPLNVGSLSDITIERVRAVGTHDKTKTSISSICGIPAAHITGVVLRDIFLQVPGGLTAVPPNPGDRSGGYPQSNQFGPTPASVFYLRHAEGVHFERVRYQLGAADVRPWIARVSAEVSTVDCGATQVTTSPPVAPPMPGGSTPESEMPWSAHEY